MNQTVFEARGEELIARAGMTKAEFARRMGIQRQNVKSLFHSPKLETVQKAALVLNLPLVYLIGYVDPIDYDEEPFSSILCEPIVIRPEEIPTGDSVEDRRSRQKLIWSYYEQWKQIHPDLCTFNYSLQGHIYVNDMLIEEAAGQASLSYLSTLAVLQLDMILQHARLADDEAVETGEGAEMQFSRVLIMRYDIVGIGRVKLTVGVRRSDNAKIQYCITAIESGI